MCDIQGSYKTGPILLLQPSCQDSLSPQQVGGDNDDVDLGLSCGVRFLWRKQDIVDSSPQSGAAMSEESSTGVAAAEMPLLSKCLFVCHSAVMIGGLMGRMCCLREI